MNQNYPPENYPANIYPPDYQAYPTIGPRNLNFFTLLLKTFLGFIGGAVGSFIFLIVFLAAGSVLFPIINNLSTDINPIFIVILMAMVFLATLASSIIASYLISLTERERYYRMSTAAYQIFIINLVIFLFLVPIYLTTNFSTLSTSAYTAGIQIMLTATAASLILEILHDQRYPLIGMYATILGILVSTATVLLIYQITQSTVIILFAVLPITWGSIGFFHGTSTIFYYWYFINFGNDFLANDQALGTDYLPVQQTNENSTTDRDGADFFHQ